MLTKLQFDILALMVAVITAVFASSGFWLYVSKLKENKDAKDKLLMGLAHDRITYLATRCIRKNYVTQEEYENLVVYLYLPYKEMGGNGRAEKLIKLVDSLQICSEESYSEEDKNAVKSLV